ncbi:MAG TPA: universal stress protein [Anaerolineae bacterium]|nr:universal stress protein [Anaerolineae bacterium]
METKLKRILVPVQGASTDEEAVNLACALSKKDKAEILLLYVIEVRRNLPIDAEMSDEIERGERVLDKVQRYADKISCRVQTDLLQAREAGAAIVNEAVERDAQLIVMGVPYHEKFGEYCVAPRAQFVLDHAACRVILAREPLPQGQPAPVTR